MKQVKATGAALGMGLLALLPGHIMAQTSVPVAVSVAADLDPNSTGGIMPEGLIADARGRLYTSDLASKNLYRVSAENGGVRVLGALPATSLGMAFDGAGNLYFASGVSVLKLAADKLEANQIVATDVVTFTTGVPQANGLIFDGKGNLYVSGAGTGTIYVVTPDGKSKVFAEGFTSERKDQPISTNGLGFGTDGKLYSANTGTGAIDRMPVNSDGTAGNIERWVKDPLLLGADGIAFASNGDLYVAANERNAVVKVTPDGKVSNVASNGNGGPLEFPASLAFSGNALYASNFDVARGVNSPNTPGVGASIARLDVGVGGLLPSQAVGSAASATPAVQNTPVQQSTTVPSVTQAAVSSTATSPATKVPTAQAQVTAAVVPATPTAAPAVGQPATGGATSTPDAVVGEAVSAVAVPAGSPEGMPRTGGPETLLVPLLTAIGGLLLAAGVAAREARARVKVRVRTRSRR